MAKYENAFKKIYYWLSLFASQIKFTIPILLLFTITTNLMAKDGQINILPNGKDTFTISKSGSYILVDNITMTTDVNCINITAEDVILDLKGHVIKGKGAGSSAAIGIYGENKVKVMNGKISSFGSDGIYLGNQSEIENITVSDNGGVGAKVLFYGKVIRVNAFNNNQQGIQGSDNCIIDRCIAEGNVKTSQYAGVQVNSNCIVRNSISRNNKTVSTDISGFYLESQSTIENCISVNNVSDNDKAFGIKTGSNCRIISNVASGNNSKSPDSEEAAGIYAGDNSIIKNNIAKDNLASVSGTGIGIMAGKGCLIEENICLGNKGCTYGSGIYVNEKCKVITNNCSENSGYDSDSGGRGIMVSGAGYNQIYKNICNKNDGTGKDNVSAGIYLFSGIGNNIDGNECNGHNAAETYGYGIIVLLTSSGNTIVKNYTNANSTYGIRVESQNNYIGENICSDSTGVSTLGSNTLGPGDRSNITF